MIAVLLLTAAGGLVTAAEPVPVMVGSGPGRFEVAAMDASAAHAVTALAEETWRLMSALLGLPAGFSSPVFVRMIVEDEMAARGESLTAGVEAGGVVSVWIRWRKSESMPPTRELRRAVARGLLLRLGVSLHGAQERATVPRWLESAVVGWCEMRANPAQLDALKYESAKLAPPNLAGMLDADPAAPESRAEAAGAVWLLMLLQDESTRAGEWPAFLRLVLGGRDVSEALSETFPGRFASLEERELWWQTGWHHVRRTRSVPGLDAAESRRELMALARFVFAPGHADVVVPMRQVLDQSGDLLVAAELKRRETELARVVGTLHPFYRNAGLSLAEAFRSRGAPAAKREAASVQFEQDWRDALELEATTTAALDALELGAAPR